MIASPWLACRDQNAVPFQDDFKIPENGFVRSFSNRPAHAAGGLFIVSCRGRGRLLQKRALASQKDAPPGSKYSVPAAPCLKLSPLILSLVSVAIDVPRRRQPMDGARAQTASLDPAAAQAIDLRI